MIIIALYHIDKTGGTALASHLAQKYQSFPYGTDHCFQTLPHHTHIFDNASWPTRSRNCRKVRHLRRIKHDARVLVEFHSWSLPRFWRYFMPRAHKLRALHAQRYNGSLRTVTLLRAAEPLILSNYIMWPPRRPAKFGGGLVPIDEWMPHKGGGLQWRQITQRKAKPLVCDVQHAIKRLRTFDLVTTIECFDPRWANMCTRAVPRYRPPSGDEENALAQMQQAHRSLLRKAAACDEQMLRSFFGSWNGSVCNVEERKAAASAQVPGHCRSVRFLRGSRSSTRAQRVSNAYTKLFRPAHSSYRSQKQHSM